mmetsp:Transcript_23473/g.46145  ORF Transcript_23473/g.46145 Transcript_23473/m.46145 type:complete len:191 (-) Transcript_23473:1134-1706(-)
MGQESFFSAKNIHMTTPGEKKGMQGQSLSSFRTWVILPTMQPDRSVLPHIDRKRSTRRIQAAQRTRHRRSDCSASLVRHFFFYRYGLLCFFAPVRTIGTRRDIEKWKKKFSTAPRLSSLEPRRILYFLLIFSSFPLLEPPPFDFLRLDSLLTIRLSSCSALEFPSFFHNSHFYRKLASEFRGLPESLGRN